MTSVWLQKAKLAIVLLILQVVFIVLYAITADYADSARPPASLMIKESDNESEAAAGSEGKEAPTAPTSEVTSYYYLFQDVHVMVFIGIGFLMTFLRRYGFSSVSFNMLLGAVILQWGMLVSGYLHGHGGKVHIGMVSMLGGDFAAATALISMGALLGKTSPLQLIVIGMLETVIFALNEWIGLSLFEVVDIGGSMFVHAFAAYFGLAVSRVLYADDITKSEKEGSSKNSDLSSMLGTVFLWLFWPSFNAALAVDDGRQRALINTYVALAACCVVTFAMSAVTNPHGKLDMVHVQNSTLAGGVAVGTTADMMIGIHGALVIGTLAGLLSVVGFKYITPFMASRLKIHDTCGIHNLHGMPAVLAGIAGCVASVIATEDIYGYTLYRQFPARVPANESSPEFMRIHKHLDVSAGQGRTGSEQALYQLAALAVTLLIAIVGGLVVGVVARFVPMNQPQGEALFEDEDNWEVPEEPRVLEVGAPLIPAENKGDLETPFNRN